jgi:hypothetical protein
VRVHRQAVRTDIVRERDMTGTVTSGDSRKSNAPAPTIGDTFEVVPQTNMQSLRSTIRSTDPWSTMQTTGATALSRGNRSPTQIGTHGEFTSPRGCIGTFGCVGTAEATRIEADFTGTDCQLAAFRGRSFSRSDERRKRATGSDHPARL